MFVQSEMNEAGVSYIKVIAIIIITISHSTPYAPSLINPQNHLGLIDLNYNKGIIYQLYTTVLINWGQIGNLLFLISSSWLLLDKDKARTEKVVKLVFDNSILTWIVFSLALFRGGYEFIPGEKYRYIFPLAYSTNWFVTAYVFLYMLHPILNHFIRSSSRKKLKIVNSLLFLMYFCFCCMWKGTYLYTGLVGFIVVYLFVAYIKLYIVESPIKGNFRRTLCLGLTVGIILHLSSVVVIYCLGIKYSRFANDLLRFNSIINPVFFLIAMSFFLLILNGIKIDNRAMNGFARLSLYIYLIQGAVLVQKHLKTDYFDYIYEHFGYSNLLLWILLYATVTTIVAVNLSAMYMRTLGRATNGISNRIGRKIDTWVAS